MNKRIALALLIAIFLAQLFVVFDRADREPQVDEIEHMHAAWMMANGERVFETFFEHHSPLIFAAIEPFAPHAERVDVRPFAIHARWLCGFAGVIALVAFASIVWRISPLGAFLSVAMLFASGPMWLRMVVDIRPEPFALAFFWCGAALVLLPRNRFATVLAGVGIALVAIGGMWTPKWPLSSVVIVIFAIARHAKARNGRIAAIAICVAMIAIASLALNAIAPLDEIRFFTVEFNKPLHDIAPRVLAVWFEGKGFKLAPGAFRLPIVLAASAIVLMGLRKQALFFVALFAATVLELRFVHPYPALWQHNYAIWSYAAAAIIGLVPMSISELTKRLPAQQLLERMIAIVATLLVLVQVAAVWATGRSDDGPYWVAQKAMRERMQPGETVWVSPMRHPVSVRNAHYYWTGFDLLRMLDTASALSETPRGNQYLPPLTNLPICGALHGTNRLRYFNVPEDYGVTAPERRCFETLMQQGRVRATPWHVYELLPAHR
ncbi:MAG: hypothetical protein ACTHQM_20460 [Thermoanaerobaculia bacterium]